MVTEHLHGADDAQLERLMRAERGALGYAFGRLWDPDPRVRGRAATAVGMGAQAHTTAGREILRRILWAMNDESATNGVFAVSALGEIGARRPDLVREFLGPAASYLWDEGLRTAILRALARIVEGAPELAAEVGEAVAPWAEGARGEDRALIELIMTTGGEA